MKPRKKRPTTEKPPAKESPQASAAKTIPPPKLDGHKRTILIAVTGNAPAVLTEAIWALAAERPPVIPDDVICITTTKGNEALQREINQPLSTWSGRSVWESLRGAVLGKRAALQDRRLMRVERIIELPDPANGTVRPVDDLRSREDNEAAADYILGIVRQAVGDNPDTRVLALISGGRKTMGALLHAAMSLLGREGDRLLHVLVNEPFDTCPSFFFPKQLHQNLTLRDGRKMEAKDARIELADVPFAPLGDIVKKHLGSKPATFMSLVRRVGKQIADLVQRDVKLIIRRSIPAVHVDGNAVQLSTAQYVILMHLAEAAKNGVLPRPDHKDAPDAIKAVARRIYAERKSGLDWKAELPHANDFAELNADWVIKKLSSLRGKLSKPATKHVVPCLPTKGRWSLEVLAGGISFED